MREIKFRGLENGQKVYGTNGDITDETGEQYRYSLLAFFSLVEKGFITNVTEYTRLKDKNDVEIYEGDILKGKYSDYNNEMKRFLGEVKYITHSFKCVGITKWYGIHIDFHSNFEIIGNVFENSELLEAKS